MATILLSAAGAAAGASLGGSVLGLSSAVVGRAVGGTVGRLIDGKILGSGSGVVETGKIDRFRLTGASEGAPIAQVHGRIRVPGQVIWATEFQETVTETGGGKGAPSAPRTQAYSYSVSLAIALCEGEIRRVGRIWADGLEISKSDLTMSVYRGTVDQLPDPRMEAVEGVGSVPAYRGTAYVVFEDLDLAPFGNRVPQFTFEVMRTGADDLAEQVRAVAMIPGTGEYALATSAVHFDEGQGRVRSANVNSPSGETDFQTSLEALVEELPACGASSLIVSWFGNDLRAGQCDIKPKVEQTANDGVGMPWEVSGVSRAVAETVPFEADRPVYGGTPSDASVVEAIRASANAGQAVMFYPFILMEQQQDNDLVDPWTGNVGQPVLPWRGRITTSLAPGVDGSTDGTAAALAEVEAFFGTATAADFVVDGERVLFTGTDGFSYRRFILHYATLCAVAGGLDAFCIGSEMRGLTQIRGANNSFPAVDEMVALADEVKAILGPDVKIGYAADWSEYFGYQPQDGSGDVFFHLDPLWSSDAIDFVGIDNYMPVSDWRDGDAHADVSWGAIYNPQYLKANIAGGEGFDWYYRNASSEALQMRTPIEDGAYGEPWVFRYKDLKGWWSNTHHNRIGGVREATSTAWVPGSKPFWFTEVGCSAIDKGTNQPNKFLDPKSSESALPKFSNGARDDLMQMQYLRALAEFWADGENNPTSAAYQGQMVDTARMFVWAWDTRPYPQFPGNSTLWSDGENYARGHWLSGRVSSRSLAGVVRELCARAGVKDVDTSALYGTVRGYRLDGGEDARSALQPVLLAAAVDVVERDGQLVFRNRLGRAGVVLTKDDLVDAGEMGRVTETRQSGVELPGRVRLNFIEADGSYEARTHESVFPDSSEASVASSEVAMVLTQSESAVTTDRWLSEARVAQDTASFSVPPSCDVMAGQVIELDTPDVSGLFRIDRIEDAGAKAVEATRVTSEVYDRPAAEEEIVPVPPVAAPLPVWPVTMNLPLLRGDENPDAVWVAATAEPWPGSAAVYGSSTGETWRIEGRLERPAMIGQTLSELRFATSGSFDRGDPLTVAFSAGSLSSISDNALLSGGNLAAVGNAVTGAWELFQFRDVELVGLDTWALSMRLRGQRGTDAFVPDVWPVGSTVVILDEAVTPLNRTPSQRDAIREYRFGPFSKPVDHPSFRQISHASNGAGLRPYRPVHLSALQQVNGDVVLNWTRQSRVDGDLWGVADVPLGEATEAYTVRVVAGGVVRRETTVVSPQWIYTADDQLADGVTVGISFEVAQISDRFGPGPFGKVKFND